MKTKLRTRLFAAGLLATVVGFAAPSHAAAWPDRPIRMVVPFVAGGNTDVVARLIAPHIEKAIGQPVVVENRPGASGNIGADNVARAAKDGYTLLMGTVGTQAINYSVYDNIQFKASDFQPVTLIASVPNVLVVNQDLPVKSVAELTAYGLKHPDTLSFASSGPGSSIHLSGELYKSLTGVQMVHVPYRGSTPALTDLIGGQVQLMFDNMPTALPFVRDGKLRALAVTSANRSPSLPDVPTMREAGVADFETGSWFGVLAPAGTPEDIVTRLDKAIQQAVAQPEMQQRLLDLGAEPMLKGPSDFAAFIDSEIVKWRAVVQASNANQ